jgi:uncharacterized protein (DUF2235 family)
MPDLPKDARELRKPRFKRLIFCFDGTWNRLAADTPTNVVLTAASVERLTDAGTVQIIHYDEGVGTGIREKYTGGIFGVGLDVNLREAYRFLLFNYDPGDEIFVFGFSRGAFTARTFVGLLRHVGPLSRLHVGRIDDAIASYRNRLSEGAGRDEELHRFRADYADGVCVSDVDDAWRCANVKGYATGAAPMLKIKFLGLWDTVAAMGVPEIFPGSSWLNRKHRYHDTTIDDFVESVRHAVAIDERRATFPATLALGLDALNAARGFAADDRKAPYQERWFPGVHGSVGGGGDIRGLSDGAMSWVLEGAKRAGLRLDTERGTRINGLAPDASAPLNNVKGAKPAKSNILMADRPGPKHAWQVHACAQRRWAGATKAGLSSIYKPKTLAAAARELDALALRPFVPPIDLIDVVIVKPKDTLSALSQRFYGAASRYMAIYDANLDELSDPDALIPGQSLRIPRLAVGSGVPPTAGGEEV